jgi:hypothetical protein
VKISLALSATVLVVLLVAYALFSKGDVKAGFKTPILEFSLDAHDKATKH